MGKIQDACWYITARSRVNKISGSCIVVCAFESIRKMTKSTPRRSKEQLRSRPLARLRFAREVSSLLTEWALRADLRKHSKSTSAWTLRYLPTTCAER